MAGQNLVEIRITASGAEQAQRVLAGVAKEGAQIGTITASGAKQAEAALGSFSVNIQKVSGLMGQAGINTGIFGQAIAALTSPLGIAAAAATGLGLAIHAATESLVRNFEEVRRLQAVSGLSADAADNLADTFQLLGFKSETLTNSLVKMAQEVDSGGKGLAKLGITLADLNGQVEGDTWLMVRDRISQLGTAGERSAIGVAILGKAFREQAALFAMSTAEFDAFQARAAKYSAWSEEAAELTHKFITSGNALTLMFDGIAQEIGAALLPGLTKANETLGDWIDAARDVLRVPIAAAWAVISSVAVGLWGAIKPLAEVLWQLAKVILPPVVAIIGGALIAGLVALQAALIPVTGTFVFLSEILKGNFTGAVKAAGDAMAAQLTNIDETLAKSKVLGDTLAALARGEVANTEDVDKVKEKSHQKNAQLDALRLQAAMAALQVSQANAAATMALEEAMVKQRVALHEAPETDLIAVQQRALDMKYAALQKAYGLELALAKQNNDLTGKAVADVQAKYIASFSQIAIGRMELSTKLLAIAQEEEQALAMGGIGLLQARLASSAALLAIQQKSTADIIAIQGSEEAAFRSRLGIETQAAIEAAEAQTKTSADFAAAVEAIMRGHYAKLAQFQQQASAAGVAAMLADMALAMKDVADLPEVAKLTTDLVALNRELMALQAPTDLDAESIRRFGVSFDLLDEATKKSLLSLRQWNQESGENKFQETLAGISRESALVGRDFDLASANLGAFQRRILELQAIKNPTGEILTEIDQLKAKFADTREFIAFRTTFQDVFASFGSALSTSVKGVVMGTQTIDEAFKKLGQSILLTLLDTVINKGLKVLTDALWDFVAGMFSGGSAGGGIIGAILTGAGALVAKAFGGTTAASVASYDQSISTLGTAAGGAAKALDFAASGVTNFSAAVSAGLSAIGVGLGIFGLAQGGSAGSMALSAGGTALSLYSLVQSASVLAKSAGLISTALPTIGEALASGLAALFPELAASIASSLANILPTAITTALNSGVAVGAFAGGAIVEAGEAGLVAGNAIAGILESITPFLEVLSGIAAPLAIAGAFLSIGLAGMASDAEDAAKEFGVQMDAVQNAMNEATKAGVIFADLGHQLDASHLVGTLHTLHDAIRDLGNLDLATGLNQILGDEGAASITAAIPAMRASVGAAWIAALDAAFQQGIFPTPGAANAPNSLGETLQSPNRLGHPGELLTTQDLLGAVSVPGPDATAAAISMLSHVLEITSEQAAAFIPMWADWVRGDGGAPAMGARIGDAFWNSFMSPEHMAQLQASGIISATNEGSPNSNKLDVDAINRLLDQEHLTTTIRNAVVDIGEMFGISKGQLGAIGAGEGNWRGTPGAGDVPTLTAIMGVQAALEAAGFVPGEYAKALEAYLVSIDANIVNNPLWKKFTDALHGTGSADDIQAAMNAAIIATMTPLKFYGAAKAFTDTLTADIKAAMAQQASMAAAGEDQAKIDAVGKLIDAMKAGIQAYAGLVSLFTALPGEMAAITGDLEAQTAAAIAAWQVTVQALGDNIQAAQKAFDEALVGGNIVAIQQTAQQLHDAVISGYNAMLKMREQAEAFLKSVLDQTSALVDMQTALAQHDITSHGSFAGITRLLGGLQGVAEHGATAAEQMWAVDQALKAIIAVLPTAIAKFGNLDKAAWLASGPQTAGQLRAAGPSQITGSVANAAAPFLAVQQAAINAATGGNKLALLQQQAAAWNNLANAAIAGVNQWAQQAITGAQEAAAAVIEGLAAEKDAKLAAIDGQIASIQKAADAEQAMRAAQMDGLQEAIAKAEEFASAIKQMGDFIQGLKVGPLGPGNPADKLAIAQDGFAKALQAYNANPTAQGLSGLQGLAQTMLSLAEPIFSKPSPQFQALAATTIKQLTAAQAMAEAIASDSEVLRSQLALLQALDKTATQAAKDQIDALNLQKQSITDDFETQTKAITAALKTQIEAIEQAAKDEIDGIQNALAVELQKNFDEQVPLLKAQYDAATAQLAAIGETKIWQDAALGILQDIYKKLATAIPAESGMDRVTEGLYHLHDGEMVLPKRMADQVRSAAEGAGMSFVPATGNNDWTSPYSQPRDLSKEGAAWGGPRAADLNRLELTIRQMQANFEAQLAHNESRMNGKIHRNFSAEALAGMQGTLAAQIAAIRAQQQAIIATVPKTPPPGTPGTTPPPPPPYVPPGPGWLSRTEGAQQSGTQTIVFQITGSKEDAEAIKETIKQVLPAVLADAKNGKLGSVIDSRARNVR